MAMRPSLVSSWPRLSRGAQQHHGTGGGEGQAKHQAGGHGPVEQLGEAKAEQGRKGYLDDGSRDGDVFHRQQVFHGKVQADTKHQQDDADFGQLGGEPQVGDIARRKGAAYHAGREVAHHGEMRRRLASMPKR